MKTLLLVLLVPSFSYAGSPPACEELGKIITNYEKDLQSRFIKDCGKLTPSDLIGDNPVNDPDFLNGKICSDLATIEAQLERLKNEQAVLIGFNKLKTTIQTSKAATGSPTPTVARKAGMTFVNSLNTAQSFEVILGTVTGSDKRFLAQILKEKIQKLSGAISPKKLQDLVNEACNGEDKKQQNACNPSVFKPGAEATEEIVNLLKAQDVSAVQVSKWQRQLAIKRKKSDKDTKDDTSYSFNQMQAELGRALGKLDSGVTMTKDELLAIQKLDDFQNESGLSFVEDLASIKDTQKNRIASDKFLLLVGDARMRQQYEVQSKTSFVWEKYKDQLMPKLDEPSATACEQARQQFNSVKACYDALMKASPDLTGDAKANLKRLLEALTVSLNYAGELSQTERNCSAQIKSKGEISEDCLGKLTRNEAEISDQILQLNLMKEKIGFENKEKMQFRNFALLKWDSQKCGKISSSMDLCEEGSIIAPEMMLAMGDTMKIAAIYAPKTESEASVKEMCENEERSKTSWESRLCEFFNDTTSNIVMPKKNDDIDGPVRAPNGGLAQDKIRDAWIGGGANLLREALGYLVKPTPPPMINPYPYNYMPYNGGKPPMGIADSIIFNARFEGAYGFYMPAAGYKPYTVGSGYQPVSQPSLSPYFSR